MTRRLVWHLDNWIAFRLCRLAERLLARECDVAHTARDLSR